MKKRVPSKNRNPWIRIACLLCLLPGCAQHGVKSSPGPSADDIEAPPSARYYTQDGKPERSATVHPSRYPQARRSDDLRRSAESRRKRFSEERREPWDRHDAWDEGDFQARFFSRLARKGGAADTVWDRLFQLYALPPADHPSVERTLERFLENPVGMDQSQAQASPYLFNIVEEIAAQGLPGELAFVPLVESEFRPFAVSPAGAVGIWQFMPSTGARFGLIQNAAYDARRDITESTAAAVEYLKELHERFGGDWLHAIAAYNAGGARVSSAIEANRTAGKPTDLWSLDLPQETRNFVPRVLAAAKLFANAAFYGLPLHPIPNRAVLESVDIDVPLDLAVAAELADLSLQELYQYNPGFKLFFIDPKGCRRLLIPVEKVDSFNAQLSALRGDERLRWTSHRVARGESLREIAGIYGITSAAVAFANDLPGRRINVGQWLRIPLPLRSLSEYRVAAASPSDFNRAREAARGYRVMHAAGGDTLRASARRVSVGLSDSIEWSDVVEVAAIHPGREPSLRLPPESTRRTASVERFRLGDDGFRRSGSL